MSFIAFKIFDYEHTAEREQYRIICNLLRAKYEASDELCIFIANYNIFDCELDGILIKSDAIISIEFKNFGGEIKAVENGHWTTTDGTVIKGGSRKSVYQQAKINHVALKHGLREGSILPKKMLKDIPSLVVFSQPIIIHNSLSERVKSWLHICDSDHFIDKVEDITSPDLYLSNEQILQLIPRLGLLDEFIDSRFSVSVNILPSKDSIGENINVDMSQDEIDSSYGFTAMTTTAHFANLEKEADSTKNQYHQFIDSLVIPALGLSSNYKLMIVHYYDFEKIMGLSLSFKSEYVAILQTKNADSYIHTLKRLFNKDVLSLSSEVIVWGEGDFEFASYPAPKISIKSYQIPDSKEAQYRDIPTEIKLPSWLDDYIFKRLNAKYQPSYTRFSYNLDLNKEECKVYLGTYFPRSFAEGFLTLDSILHDPSITSILKSKQVLKILDFGCGTGGELLGFLHALENQVESNLSVKIIGIDANHHSLRMLDEILNCYNSRDRNKVEFVVAPCFIETQSDLSTISGILGTDFDFIITSKAIGEFENKKRIEDNGYEFFARIFAPLLCKTGIMAIIDVTTKNEHNGLFLPQIMNIGVNAFLSKSQGLFKSIAPCSGQSLLRPCKHRCFYKKDIYISHSAKANDHSKFAVRLITRNEFNLDETYVREVFYNLDCKLNKTQHDARI